MRTNWAIFISGKGSNLCAAIDEVGDQIKLVVTSNPKAGGILRAKRAGIEVLELKRPIDWQRLTKDLRVRGINKIFLLGFMKIIPLEFIQNWSKNIINLHPSLLPLYPGLESIRKAYEDKAEIGVSVHEVIPEVDAGRILIQKKSFRTPSYSLLKLGEVEMKVHQDEQILVRKVIGSN